MNAPQRPYRAYSPRPFKPEERDGVEILFGGLGWRAEKLIQAAFENVGHRARTLPNATRDDLLLGRELADIGQCFGLVAQLLVEVGARRALPRRRAGGGSGHR